MLKAIGTLNLALAPVFVIPAVTQDGVSGAGLDAQLDATLRSLEYVAGLRDSVRAGDAAALRALERATEAPRDASSPQRSAHLQALQDDIAELRYSLDRLLADPAEVSAVMSLPPSVLSTLGLAASPPPVPATTPSAVPTSPAGVAAGAPTGMPQGADTNTTSPSATTGATGTAAAPAPIPTSHLAGVKPTTGIGAAMHRAIEGDVGPLDEVRPTSRRRGDEPAPLEGEGYVADPVRLGRLFVRSGRTSEAIELLEAREATPGTQYWLARAYAEQERFDEALEIFRVLAADESAGAFARHAAQDLEFLEFKRALEARQQDR